MPLRQSRSALVVCSPPRRFPPFTAPGMLQPVPGLGSPGFFRVRSSKPKLLGPGPVPPLALHPAKVSSSSAAVPHRCGLLPSCRSSLRRPRGRLRFAPTPSEDEVKSERPVPSLPVPSFPTDPPDAGPCRIAGHPAAADSFAPHLAVRPLRSGSRPRIGSRRPVRAPASPPRSLEETIDLGPCVRGRVDIAAAALPCSVPSVGGPPPRRQISRIRRRSRRALGLPMRGALSTLRPAPGSCSTDESVSRANVAILARSVPSLGLFPLRGLASTSAGALGLPRSDPAPGLRPGHAVEVAETTSRERDGRPRASVRWWELRPLPVTASLGFSTSKSSWLRT